MATKLQKIFELCKFFINFAATMRKTFCIFCFLCVLAMIASAQDRGWELTLTAICENLQEQDEQNMETVVQM